MAIKALDLFESFDQFRLRIALQEARVAFWEKRHKVPSINEINDELLDAQRSNNLYFEGLFASKI